MHRLLVLIALQNRFVFRKFGHFLRLHVAFLESPAKQWTNHQFLKIKLIVEFEEAEQQFGTSLLVARIVRIIVVEREIEIVDDLLGYVRLKLEDWRNDWQRDRLQIEHKHPHQGVIRDSPLAVAMVQFHPALDDGGQEIDSGIECQQMRQNRSFDCDDAIEEVQVTKIARSDVQTIQDWRTNRHECRQFDKVLGFLQ